MTTFNPTPEQSVISDCFKAGGDVRVQAGAGTGKTSTLKMLAEQTSRRGRYLAFNKALTEDAKASMPANVTASTIHSLAFGAVGKHYAHRLRAGRITSNALAQILGIERMAVDGPHERKLLAPGYLAGVTMRALRNFCQSADTEPGPEHFPYIDGIDGFDEERQRREWINNRAVRHYLTPMLLKAWADVQRTDGKVRFAHEHYLKMYALGECRIFADFIMVDEYQDVAPVMQQIMSKQADAQIVGVGDSAQAIYGFTGAIDALERMDADHDAWLTQSFRFGPAIAEQANKILKQLGSDMQLKGTDAIPSEIRELVNPKAILTRTNATGVVHLLQLAAEGRAAHMVGGGREVVDFAQAATMLRKQGHCYHPELACFTSWAEVQTYVAEDPQGGELKLLVDLVDEFGADVITEALQRMPDERHADVVVSTAHKSKGRQWDTVQLAEDFPEHPSECSTDELRLLYVAATRARRTLDISAVGALAEDQGPEESGAEVVDLMAALKTSIDKEKNA